MSKTTVIKLSFFETLGILCLAIILAFPLSSVSALSGSSFKAGRIIDDAIFFKHTSMSAGEIQSFLNSKVPDCDTQGEEIYSGSTTRAQYGSSRGNPPPYTCLKNATKTIPSKAADSYCTSSIASSGGVKKSAATIISKIATACDISPKVLLVTLQKEESLVTDDWPWKVQYTKAMGYGCPDSDLPHSVDGNNNGCYDQYEGFFNQIYYAARQFQRYAKNGDSYNHQGGQTSFVQYNPNSSCGGKNIYMSSQATAGLYNYTPYTPNQAALDNLYGTGNSCSAYGNRNFWRLYNDWFGSTLTTPIKVSVTDSSSSESGATAEVRFSLVTQPTANVTIPLSISNTAEATLSGVTSKTITPSNWNHPENNEVTITGLDDSDADGDIKYTLITGNPSSSDTTYGNLAAGDVKDASLTNNDNEPDVAVAGDWDGDGRDEIALKRGSTYLLNYNNDGSSDDSFSFGRDDDTPIAGDWDGDGRDEIGLKRGSTYYLNYGRDSDAEVSFSFGQASDAPIAGDWDKDGRDEIGIRRGSKFYLNYNNDSDSEASFSFGQDSDTPLAGDWDKDGRDEVGLKRLNKYYLNYDKNGKAEVSFSFGQASDIGLAGDWDKDHRDEIGIRRGNTYYLTYDNNGTAEVSFVFGR